MTLMFGLVKLTAALLALSGQLGVEGLWCDRTPAGVNVPKTPGDNGYKIVISGDTDKYIPGGVYSVRLQGPGDQYTVEKFSGFLLVAEPADAHSPESSAGSFQLTSDSLARFSEFCPHAVKHASELPKAEVQVRWTAPPVSAGCVVFRATIIKNKGQWFMDDGALTKQLCPENEFGQDEGDNFEPCCACDEAKYELTFEGLWSPLTHPKDFPANTLSAHFSDIIGASHSPNFRFWEYGGEASEGLKNIAEQGDTRALEGELKEKSGNIRTIIKARGLKHPNFYGYKTFAVFRADRDHNLVSLVSKIDPSPDWFVGVSGLNLCTRNCSWAENKVVNLFPWDAGTNNGITYSSPGEPTIPQDRIRRIVWNSNENSPFYDPNGNMVKPFARLRLVKQRSYERACDTDYRRPGSSGGDTAEDEMHDETEHQHRPECQVSLWSDYGPCSATCGRGFQVRTRTYVNEMKAMEYGCRRKLKDTTQCFIPGNCNERKPSSSLGSNTRYGLASGGSGSSSGYGSRGAGSSSRGSGRGRSSHPCATTDYGAWSLCSTPCGRGIRRRTRDYLDSSLAREYNCRESLQQQEVCIGRSPSCGGAGGGGDDEQIEPGCEVTAWSEWSECSVTCGKGSRKRTRLYVNPRLNHQKCNLEMTQYETCEGIRPDCNEPEDWKEICKLPKQVGMCPNDGNLTRWYFDVGKLRCQKFTYHMCKGNQNNFVTEKECEDKCNVLRQNLSEESMYGTSRMTGSTTWPAYQPPNTYGAADGPSIDCVVSKWSKWSKCSTTCGQGFKARTRYIKVFNENGGRPCPHLRETQTCTDYTCQPSTPYRYLSFDDAYNYQE